jgi:hypothetical protein
MVCPLWDPTVFTIVEYVLATVSRKVFYKSFLETVANTYSTAVNTMGFQSGQNIWQRNCKGLKMTNLSF